MSQNMPEVISVSRLTMQIKFRLEQEFSSMWVSGEIVGLSRPASGHIYFNLKDKQSQIRAVIWRSNAERMNLDFLEEGLQVMAFGNIDVYGPRGVYQLNLRKLQPLGEGAWQLAFRKLHAKLEAEGLFAAEHKQPIPRIPKHVAVITSPTGAAVRDFLQVLQRRWPNIRVTIIPVPVQGPGSAEQITDALYACADFADAPDVVVLTRGGGSIEDLWSFNDERVCRAIFHCPIPVVSGVGHEIDVTLADLVADMRALTPSEAAERLVPDQLELKAGLSTFRNRLRFALQGKLDRARQSLDALASRPVISQPLMAIRNHERQLDDLNRYLTQTMKINVEQNHQVLKNLAARMETLNPVSVLARGYSLATNEQGDLVTDSKQVDVGDKLSIRLTNGSVETRVEGVPSDREQ